MRTVLLLLASFVMSACVGDCRASPAEPSAPPPAPAKVEATAPQTVGHNVAAAGFDIAASSDGAVIAWAEDGPCNQALHVMRLDAHGRSAADGKPVSIPGCVGVALSPEARVDELVLAADGGKLGLAWIAQDARNAHVLATHGSDDANVFAPTLELSPAALASVRGVRGRLSINAAPTGQMRVSFRAPQAACVGEPGVCTQLVTQSFPPRPSAAGRGTDRREIKAPCPRLLVGAHFAAGTWYDAFCTLGSGADAASPLSQVFAIRPEISYAEVISGLPGCEPLGMSPAPSGVVLWGRCADGVNAQLIAPDGATRVLANVQTRADCEQGRPRLRVAGDNGALSLALDEPRSRLEALLPSTLAPPGARAVFTGQRLIVAFVGQGALVIRSYGCRGDELVPEQ